MSSSKHLHVATAGENVIESAVTDVVTPAVTADDPDALAHKRVGQREQTFCDRIA